MLVKINFLKVMFAPHLLMCGLLSVPLLSGACSLQVISSEAGKGSNTVAYGAPSNLVSILDGQRLGGEYILNLSATLADHGGTGVESHAAHITLTMDVRSAVAARVHCYYAQQTNNIYRLPVAVSEEFFSAGQQRRFTVLTSQSGRQLVQDITMVFCLAFDHADTGHESVQAHSLPDAQRDYRDFYDVYELYRKTLPGNVVGRSVRVQSDV